MRLARISHHGRDASLALRYRSAFASLTNTESIRLAIILAAAFNLVGCALLSQWGILPPAGSAHLLNEPVGCGMLDDPVRQTPLADPIIGAADFHIHQFSNLGFGGRLLWGDSFHEGGIEEALSPCGVDELCADSREAFVCREVLCRFASDRESCAAGCDRNTCEETPPHGRFGLTDPLGFLLGQGTGHAVSGHPDYQGWPRYNSYTHQQAYHRWLRRAFDGGLKLLVMMAVSNEVLCKAWENDHACDDMTNADLQLEAAENLERFIDYQNDCAYNHNGWYRIAHSPSEARKIISEGAMAVVLGLELDTLFNCYADKPLQNRKPCTVDFVREQISKYRDRGVRHIFPVHVFDNGFGGAALYNDFFNFGNGYTNSELFAVKDCSPEYEFRFGKIPRAVDDVLASISRTFGFPYKGYRSMSAHCNTQGLTDLGIETIKMLMDHKIIIDVDHMSAKMRDEVLSIAEHRAYSGLISGHSGFTKLYQGQKKSEGQLTQTEVERLVELGGLLAPILNQGKLKEMVAFKGTSIPLNCGNSAQSFAHAYLYAVEAMNGGPVGFGSDLNGFAGMPTPRFGLDACGGDKSAEQTNRVEYPIQTFNDLGGEMGRSQVGRRQFDINIDGYAHVGMFPDFVAELKAIGVTDEKLKPLFSSAEAYISLWEKVEE